MATGTAGVRGFLFCDLRGYSTFVDRHGDHAAATLLDAYRSVVRKVVALHDGAEIRTEGDSFYVVFPSASAAVEAALGIVDGAAAGSTAETPIRVGVGIHAGETVETDEGPVGGAVNIAARVCAKARPGEVLVTDTVRALTKGLLPYTYVPLGTQSLKGVAGVALYRVEAVSSGRGAHLRRRLSAHRRLVAAVAGLALVALVGSTAGWALTRPPDCVAVDGRTADVVLVIDPARKCVVEAIAVGRRPDAIEADDTGVWVANKADWTVTRIPFASRRPALVVGLPGEPIAIDSQPTGPTDETGRLDVLTYDDRTLADLRAHGAFGMAHRVVSIRGADQLLQSGPGLPAEGTIGWENAGYGAPPDSSYTGLAAANGRTWVVSRRGGVVRLLIEGPGAPGVTQVIEPIQPTDPTGSSPEGHPRLIAATGGVIWLVDEEASEVQRFDGPVARATASMTLAGGGARALATDPTGLWVLGRDGALTRIDTATNTQRRIPLSVDATAIAADHDAVWLLDREGRTASRIDPTDGTVIDSLGVGGLPQSAVLADGLLWVTVAAP